MHGRDIGRLKAPKVRGQTLWRVVSCLRGRRECKHTRAPLGFLFIAELNLDAERRGPTTPEALLTGVMQLAPERKVRRDSVHRADDSGACVGRGVECPVAPLASAPSPRDRDGSSARPRALAQAEALVRRLVKRVSQRS